MVAFLLALFQLNEPQGWASPTFLTLLVSSIVLLSILLWVERRAKDPILPLPLFRDRLFVAATGHGLFAGFALFGSIAFVPFFVQAVLGTSATTAGVTLIPLNIGWVFASIVGSRLLLRFGHRCLALTGMTMLVIGMLLMTQIGSDTPLLMLFVNLTAAGIGMGLSIPAFLIAVQSTVPHHSLGTATSSVQFFRSIGGLIGVSVMGVILTLRLADSLIKAGIDPKSVSLGLLLDSANRVAVASTLAPIRDSLAVAFQGVFVVALIAALLGWIVTTLAPRGKYKWSTNVEQ